MTGAATQLTSWPGLFRPPMSLFQKKIGVDGRHKAGRDNRVGVSAAWYKATRKN
jgi:hypothetical protein